jgi:hypothetical protein
LARHSGRAFIPPKIRDSTLAESPFAETPGTWVATIRAMQVGNSRQSSQALALGRRQVKAIAAVECRRSLNSFDVTSSCGRRSTNAQLGAAAVKTRFDTLNTPGRHSHPALEISWLYGSRSLARALPPAFAARPDQGAQNADEN